MYHSIGNPADHRLAIRVPPENFRRQLDEIAARGYFTKTVSDIIKGGAAADRTRDIALTFDDGYKDNVTEVAAAIAARGMKATFFVTTSYIDGKSRNAWTDGSRRVYMDWDDVARLGRMGFEIGSHMIDHIALSDLDDEAALAQLKGSKDEILSKTGIDPKTISYPYGKLNGRIVSLVKKAGYTGGCSTIKGLNGVSVDPYLLRRTEVDGYDTIHDFRAKLSGYYD
ncbi:MAG: polysaccharide deacetylase family protein [Candidatus Omnitrophica bacterium]|nr:polysaccharide deacetylase family protein [Candidatus Omnitrophota bacterium]